jgi:peptidylprolyl isomerase
MQMQKVDKGIFVGVAYTGTLENGGVFDSSEGRRPLEFQPGAGQLIEGFEDGSVHRRMKHVAERA